MHAAVCFPSFFLEASHSPGIPSCDNQQPVMVVWLCRGLNLDEITFQKKTTALRRNSTATSISHNFFPWLIYPCSPDFPTNQKILPIQFCSRQGWVDEGGDGGWDFYTKIMLNFPRPTNFPPIAFAKYRNTHRWIRCLVRYHMAERWTVSRAHHARVPLGGCIHLSLSALHSFQKLYSLTIYPWGHNCRVCLFSCFVVVLFVYFKHGQEFEAFHLCCHTGNREQRSLWPLSYRRPPFFLSAQLRKAICLFKAPWYWDLCPICYPLS